MEVTVRARNDWQREFEILVPAERVSAAMDAGLRRYARRAQLPGFRKGKAPLDMVKRVYGEAIEDGAVNDLLPQVLQEAADREGLEPAAPPRVDQVERTDDGGLRLHAWVEVKPEFAVKGMDRLRARREARRIGAADVDRALESLRLRAAQESVVDRPAQEGDLVVMRLKRIDRTGLPLVGERAVERGIQLGSQAARTLGLDEQVAGARAGEVRRLRVPASEMERQVRGESEVHYRATVREVRRRQVPDLDDAFAGRIAKLESLAELRARVEAELVAEADAEADQGVREQLMDALLAENPFEPPASMVERLLEVVTEDAQRAAGQGFDAEIFAERARPGVVREVRWHLVMDRLARQEGLAPSDAELDEAIRQQAETTRTDAAELRRRLEQARQLERLRGRLLERKVLAFLKERAQIEGA